MAYDASFRRLVSGKARGITAAAARGLLALLEPAYGAVIRSRNHLFDSAHAGQTKLAAPVISVGNLTVGGTGKTPLVCWLAEWFEARGMAVTLISRGYGAKRGQVNDEALELVARLPGVPHLQNADRVAAARAALQATPRQALILDDAFQHRRIARDLDIVLLDALAPFGYEHLLPRGLLREPVESLARAHVVALSRADAIDAAARAAIRDRVRKVAPRAIWLELEHRPTALVNATGIKQPLESYRGKDVAAFCGIGNPDGFRHTLASCGFNVTRFREFPDHCPYSAAELGRLESWAGEGEVEAAICTRKDLVKIPRAALGGRPLWALDIQIHVASGEAELTRLLAPLAVRVAADGVAFRQ
jgi:tetraacyldisaccharide 4'-kinase